MAELISITPEQLQEVLDLLPPNLVAMLSGKINLTSLIKYDKEARDYVEAFYLHEKGEIQIYGFLEDEIKRFDYVHVICHEIGHFIYQELLDRKDRIKWIDACLKEVFPIKLVDVYNEQKIFEEQFCITYSLICFETFVRRKGMEKELINVKGALKDISKRTQCCKKVLKAKEIEEKGERDLPEIACYRKITRRVRKWIDSHA
jgi:hypothetical protein